MLHIVYGIVGIKSGSYIYNVSDEPELYDLAH